MSHEPLIALPLEQLRRRNSTKWRKYDPDVLPLFVAEHDFPLAPAITRVLAEAVELGDTGYTPPQHALFDAYAQFSARRLGAEVDPARIRTTADVMMGLVEILRAVITPGDGVVVTSPVYPPFFDTVVEGGGTVVNVPLLDDGTEWSLDLAGIEAAFAAGAKAMFLCNPHNPTGTLHSKETLAALGELAAKYGAWIISDEIHAPLTRPGQTFTSFLRAGDAAAARGFVVNSPSKTYNLAGLKAAVMVTAVPETTRIVNALPWEVEWRTGLFGMLAGVAAYAEESDAWLDSLLAALDVNRTIVADGWASVPGASHRVPNAGYLAWADVSALGLRNPSKHFLNNARVALNPGSLFGEGGQGRVRLNFGCSPEVLHDGFARIRAAL